MHTVNTDQGEEIASPAGDLDRGRGGGDRRLDLTSVRHVLGPKRTHTAMVGTNMSTTSPITLPTTRGSTWAAMVRGRRGGRAAITELARFSRASSCLCCMWSVRMEEEG